MEFNSDLIAVKQLPVIEEQLRSVKAQFEEAVAHAMALECTEDTLKEVRATRADLTKVFHALEKKRKEAKAEVLAPYLAFEEIYKECVTDVYKPCDEALAGQIHGVEDELKAAKAAEIREYFDEYAEAKGIDFVSFDRVELNVTLNASKKSLREKVAEFLDGIASDVEAIKASEDADEIMVEYKKTLSLSQATLAVKRRHDALETERKLRENFEALEALKKEAFQKVADAVEEEAFTAPVEEEPEPEEKPTEKIYEATFTVKGTIEQIKALKAFLVEGGYDYVC